MKKFFQKFSHWIKIMLNTMWVYRSIVVSLLVVYVVLWHIDQGQDLLINLNDGNFGVVIFYLVITITAALHWHLPKYLSDRTDLKKDIKLWDMMKCIFSGSVEYQKMDAKEIKYVEDSDLARLIGVLTFLIPAFGVLNVMEKYGLGQFYPHVWLIGITGFYTIIFRYNWLDNLYEKSTGKKWIFHVIIGACLIAIASFGFLNQNRPSDLRWLCLGLCLMSVVFTISLSIRRNLPEKGIGGFFKYRSIAGYIMWPSVGLALFFIFVNVFPLYMAHGKDFVKYSTVSALLCGLLFYVLFFGFLMFWGRSTKINIAGLFLAIALISASVVDNKFHDVRRISSTSSTQLSFEGYVRNWLHARSEQIGDRDSLRPYPVFIVNSWGGGIRAAAWTSFVICKLDSSVNRLHTSAHPNDSSTHLFQDHVLAYSGASGGTVGASVMCALRSSNPDKIYPLDSIKHFYRSDFLSPVMIGLIGRDFFFSTFGVNMKDRAALQEEVWEHHVREHFRTDAFEKEMNSLWSGVAGLRIPLLFSNTIQIDSGLKGLAVPVKLKPRQFPAVILVSNLLRPDEGLRLSTASFLSARFPIISPAGRMDSKNHFMDGGIKENSGGETAREIAQVFNTLLQSDTTLKEFKNRLQVFILSLDNSPVHAPEEAKRNLAELTAPLKALVNNTNGYAIRSDYIDSIMFGKNYFRMEPLDTGSAEFRAVLPLGWQISNFALDRLKSSLTLGRNKQNLKDISKLLQTD